MEARERIDVQRFFALLNWFIQVTAMNQWLTLIILTSFLMLPYRLFAQETLSEITSHDQCTHSCFQGIEPGVTSKAEFEAWLEDNDIPFTHKAIRGGSITLYALDWSNLSLSISEESGNVSVVVISDTVQEVSVSLKNVTVSDVINTYGSPTSIGNTGSNVFVYESGNLVFTVSRSNPKTVDFLTIMTSDAINGGYEDIAPCDGQINVCRLATATLVSTANPSISVKPACSSKTATFARILTSTPSIGQTQTPTPSVSISK